MLKIVKMPDSGVGKSARLAPVALSTYALSEGDFVRLEGRRSAIFYVELDATLEDDVVALDETGMKNVGLPSGGEVFATKAKPDYAAHLVLKADSSMQDGELSSQAALLRLKGYPVDVGDVVRLSRPYGDPLSFRVSETFPGGEVLVTASTDIDIEKPDINELSHKRVTYADIGGLAPQLRRVREMIELPLKFPEVFLRIGIEPPKGVLLYGPPGTGKTVIARAVANECSAWFTSISGPEVIGKYYGESEERLRAVFEEASANAPSVIFIDEIDAIAPKREEMGGEKQVERRVVAQLLTLMDGLSSRGQVVVIAATNIQNTLDPALRRPGRFDREIAIPIPDSDGRLEILKIHTRGMPLSDDVDLPLLAEMTHGFVGADIQALAKEAAMMALRRIMPSLDSLDGKTINDFGDINICMDDFMNALREIEPSAIREVFAEIPNTRWSDIGGLQDIKRSLVEAVEWPLKHRDVFKKYGVTPPHGIMIHGASGTGKTLLVKALAHESGVNFITVSGPALMSRYMGESERSLRDVFRKARQAAPSILYFDEIDSLLPRRGDDSSTQSHIVDRVISQFLIEMGGSADLGGVVVVATTSRLERIDPAVFSAGRFELVLELPMPDLAAREEIFNICLSKMPASGIDVPALAELTGGMTGAQIAQICKNAAMNALRESITSHSSGEPKIEMRHFSILGH